jgi:hypothetical protein
MNHLPAGQLPRTFQNGRLLTVSPHSWVSGFYPGTLLYLYEYSHDTAIEREAFERLSLLEKNKFITAHHDLGFMMYCSYGNAYRLTGARPYRDILVRSAQSLASRFDPRVGCIKSWDSVRSLDGKRMLQFPVIIDNMMNLELLFFASKVTGDPLYRDIAIKHAETTMTNHLRPDYSCYHVVNYDPQTGRAINKETQQGFSDNSTWSRGQAWGIYGFTMVYRETKDKKFLEVARKMADHFIDHPRLPADKIPYWDFNVGQPGYTPPWHYDSTRYAFIPRDASAAAITASALIELSGYLDGPLSENYLGVAEQMLQSLSSPAYRAAPKTNGGMLLMHASGGVPGNVEVDVPLSYADYYCVEAMMRYRKLAGIRETKGRDRISLAGNWQFQTDPNHTGINDHWFDSLFQQRVYLPGSMAENRKGDYAIEPTTQYLNAAYHYVGAAWYKREVEVPASWKDKQIRLFLERSKATHTWIDGKFVGSSTLLSAPQRYDCTGMLSPGRHTITIMVDNDPSLVHVGGSHALSDHTQTNWNGIIGDIYLEESGGIYIEGARIWPDVKNKSADVQIHIKNRKERGEKITIQLAASSWNSPVKQDVQPMQVAANIPAGDTTIIVHMPMGEKVLLWSEYHPALYRLTINLLEGQEVVDSHTENFGMRRFEASGTQFRNNGVVTFLRGNNDGCIFPLTGYPPTDTASWRRIFRIARSYGINHYRFHSYTPPAAAFESADVEGIYIQTELPLWANLYKKDTALIRFQNGEGKAILDAYGNHPSFVMFSLGNELAGDAAVHDGLIKDLKNDDGARRLYARGTNAFFTNPRPGPGDDFWVTMRTGKETTTGTYDVRGSFATTEDAGNGIINSQRPSTRRRFSSAIKGARLPVIGHETGQYQVYPDYHEIPLYTGVLRPHNVEIFQQRLYESGIGDQADSFMMASGKLAALLYREEIEMALRTPGFGGFQLLDLQDYPGQGTALVGILNAFMESKGLISPEEFRRFNNDAVIQLLMDKYAWTNDETWRADIQLVNYTPQKISGKKLLWKIVRADTHEQVASGSLRVNARSGSIERLGRIAVPLKPISKAEKLLVQLAVNGTALEAEYPVWVYPSSPEWEAPANVIVSDRLTDSLLQKLKAGARVILFPDCTIAGETVKPQFISEFWNWKVFKAGAEKNGRPVSAGTLGILANSQHPLFNNFPTEYYTNWQWWPITHNARPLVLDKAAPGFRPIVQVIDNIDRNHKLGLIFECRLGQGSLLVCMAGLPQLQQFPEARQLYHSMLQYAASDRFQPTQVVSEALLRAWLF